MAQDAKQKFWLGGDGPRHSILESFRQDGEWQSIIVVVSSCLYYVFLVFLFVGPLQQYAYYETYDLNLNGIKLAVGLILVLCGTLLLPKSNQPMALFFWLLFILIIIPRFVQFACRNDDYFYPIACFSILLVASYVGNRTPMKALSKATQINRSVKLRTLFILAGFTVILAVIVYMAVRNGLPTSDSFDFSLTYSIRSANDFSSYESSALLFVGAFIMPFFISYLLATESTLLACLASACQVLLFMWTAMKGWLFVLGIVWLVWLLRKLGLLSVPVVVVGFTALAGGTLALYQFDSGGLGFTLFSLVFRRGVFVPSTLGYEYYNFFADRPVVLLQNTVLKFLTPMPNEYSAVAYETQVGKFAYGDEVTTWANTGLFGGEFANFGPIVGLVAIFVNLLLFAILLRAQKGFVSSSFLSFVAVVYANNLLNASSIRLLFSITGMVSLIIVLLMLSLCLQSDSDVGHSTRSRGLKGEMP